MLIPVAIAEVFNPIAELIIPIGKPIKEGKAETEIHPVIVEAEISKCSIWIKVAQIFLCFLLVNSFYFISSIK